MQPDHGAQALFTTTAVVAIVPVVETDTQRFQGSIALNHQLEFIQTGRLTAIVDNLDRLGRPERIKNGMSTPAEEYIPSEVEVTAIASEPSIKRALELQRLDMRWEAKAEWVWATRNFDDKKLLAAATAPN